MDDIFLIIYMIGFWKSNIALKLCTATNIDLKTNSIKALFKNYTNNASFLYRPNLLLTCKPKNLVGIYSDLYREGVLSSIFEHQVVLIKYENLNDFLDKFVNPIYRLHDVDKVVSCGNDSD